VYLRIWLSVCVLVLFAALFRFRLISLLTAFPTQRNINPFLPTYSSACTLVLNVCALVLSVLTPLTRWNVSFETFGPLLLCSSAPRFSAMCMKISVISAVFQKFSPYFEVKLFLLTAPLGHPLATPGAARFVSIVHVLLCR